ncbi:hypothetical protein [Caldanaerobacter sp.]|uniref:hypothetical protein n=1 Tax=Caldanaerobacter sp. TaxID=2930036 RepID=UPI003C77A77A
MERILNLLKRVPRERGVEEVIEVRAEREKLDEKETEEEIVAVVMAAISAYMREDKKFYITSIKEMSTGQPLWSLVGRIEQMQARSIRRYW